MVIMPSSCYTRSTSSRAQKDKHECVLYVEKRTHTNLHLYIVRTVVHIKVLALRPYP